PAAFGGTAVTVLPGLTNPALTAPWLSPSSSLSPALRLGPPHLLPVGPELAQSPAPCRAALKAAVKADRQFHLPVPLTAS
ncbi:MAG: hypothetical protein ABIK37_07145, partial [candidate division WOR-3 bacterium]